MFGAAVTQDGIQILSTNAELLAFFSAINSEAKPHLLKHGQFPGAHSQKYGIYLPPDSCQTAHGVWQREPQAF